MGRREKTIHLEDGTIPSLNGRMRLARQAKKISLTKMAELSQYSKSYLSSVENGNIQSPLQLVQQYEELLGLELGTLNAESPPEIATTNLTLNAPPPPLPQHYTRIDWGDAPLVIPQKLLGRKDQYDQMEQWIKDKHTHLVIIWGLGGIGKTTLASFATDSLKDQFDYVYWRSLQNAPDTTDILRDCLQFLLEEEQVDIPDSFDNQLPLLMKYLREHRCLLILDNLEAVIGSEENPNAPSEDDRSYTQLLRAIGEGRHQSCLLLTSREKPKVVAHMEFKTMPIHSLALSGLAQDAAHQLLTEKALDGTAEEKTQLIDYYTGNPLALKLVSEFIREFFASNINAFLHENELMIGEVADLLDQHFARLTPLERSIIYWMAIEREEVTPDTLQQNLLQPVSKSTLLQSIDSLLRRCMLEKNNGNQAFFLQPVIRGYVTKKLLEEMILDLEEQTFSTFCTYALLKAHASETVRQNQTDAFLKPIEDYFLKKSGAETYRVLLTQTLATLREHTLFSGYAASNALHLLIHGNFDTSTFDFSHFTLLQAYLQGVSLPGINFSFASFKNSIFTETFGNILSVALSPDGHYLIAGTANGTVCLWDRHKNELLRVYHHHQNWVRSVTFCSDGIRFASGGDDEVIYICDIHNEQPLQILRGHEQRVRCVLFTTDGTTLISSSDDTTIRLWNLESATAIKILDGHTHRVRSLALNPDGTLLASGSDDKTIRLWLLSDTSNVHILSGHTHRVRSVIFSPDGQKLASCSDDQTIRIWNIHDRICLHVFSGHKHLVRTIVFNADGTTIASGSEDHDIRLWHIHTGQSRVLTGHTNAVKTLIFHPSSKILVSGGDDQAIRFWDSEHSQRLHTIQGYSSWIYSVAFSPNGQFLASGSQDHNVRLWSVATGERLHTLSQHKGLIYAVTFSPDGNLLASCSQDREIRLWDMKTLECVKILRGHRDQVNSVAFSPDGQLLASGGEDNIINLWQVATGKLLATLSGHTHRVRTVTFHPSGKLLASASEDTTIRIWQLETTKCIHILEGHTDQVRSITFNPTGTLLASGSEDTTLRLWEVSTGNCKATLKGHKHRIRATSFSPDGTLLASGSEDWTVRFWKVSSGELLPTILQHQGLVYTVTFNPDNTTIASGSYDGTIKLWQADTGMCLHTLLSEGPYQGMHITASTGLTRDQKDMLLDLGAIE